MLSVEPLPGGATDIAVVCHLAYRDLIDGTDIIIDISTKCHSILDSILAIQVRLKYRVPSCLQHQQERQHM